MIHRKLGIWFEAPPCGTFCVDFALHLTLELDVDLDIAGLLALDKLSQK